MRCRQLATANGLNTLPGSPGLQQHLVDQRLLPADLWAASSWPRLRPSEPFCFWHTAGSDCAPQKQLCCLPPPPCPADVPGMVLAGFPDAPNWLIMLVGGKQDGCDDTCVLQRRMHFMPYGQGFGDKGEQFPVVVAASSATAGLGVCERTCFGSILLTCLAVAFLLQANVCILVHMLAAFQVATFWLQAACLLRLACAWCCWCALAHRSARHPAGRDPI